MHPALSVIIFTVISGAGYGLLALIAIFTPLGLIEYDSMFILTGVAFSLVLITAGLLSSTFHLGHPERSWRALTQWRSSWLSREGVFSLLTYIPATAFVAFHFYIPGIELLILTTGILTFILCTATVYTTSMIYASLTPIPAWNNHWVPFLYMGFSLISGFILLHVMLVIFSFKIPFFLTLFSLISLLIICAVKLFYWYYIDHIETGSTTESATGLGSLGKVSVLQAPHTQENYIMKEMGFRIARKHTKKLRYICFSCIFLIPSLLILLTIFLNSGLIIISIVLSAVFLTIGLLIERWLFFAEAKHIVMLYY